jgi:hypothetical protein
MNMEWNHSLEEDVLMLLMIWEHEDMQAQLPLIPGEQPARSAPIAWLTNYGNLQISSVTARPV